MNKKILILGFMVLSAVLIAACGGQAGPANTENANTENSNTAEAPDSSAAVIEAEKKGYDAWKNKDGKYFEEAAADNYVGNGPFYDKASVVKFVNEFPCDVKDVKLEDPQTVELTSAAVLVTSKEVADYTCDGKPGASPLWAAGLFVKDGDKWKVAFHQVVHALDAKGERMLSSIPANRENATDDLTKNLSEMDKKAWEAWSKKDSKFFEDWASDAYVSLDSDGRTDKAKLVKEVAEMQCEVKGFSMEGFKAVQVSENVAILTYTASQDVKCGDNALPGNVFASTVYVKDGDSWKGAFHIETPAKSGGEKKAYGPGGGGGAQ